MGIIGFGVQGGGCAGFITEGKVEGMVLGGICDIDPEKKKKAEQEYPDVPFFENYEDMIGSGKVDCVITTVPHLPASGDRYLCHRTWDAGDHRKTGRCLHQAGETAD